METLEPKLEHGIWLGVCSRTAEPMIGTAGGIVRAGTVKRRAIEDAWSASVLLSLKEGPWNMGRQSSRHELNVENDEDEPLTKINDAEEIREPHRFRILKQDIDRVGYSDGCVGCNAMRSGKAAQRHSEYCRRRVQEELKGTEEGRQRLEKAEERFTEALARACERIVNFGYTATMSAAAQAGDTEAPQAPSEGGMSYAPTSPATSPRGQDIPESTEELPPSADDGRQSGQADQDQDAERAGLTSRNSVERGHKRRPSRPATGERASSSTRVRRSEGDDDDRYEPSRDIDVGGIATQKNVSTQQRNQWDEDGRP